MSSAVLSLHLALAAALHRDLPDLHYEQRDFEAEALLRQEVGQNEFERRRAAGELPPAKLRRPREEDVHVVMFLQQWSSTALGYGGIGGQAFTSAYTVVVQCEDRVCVYFGKDALAYTVPVDLQTAEQAAAWQADLASHRVLGRRDAVQAYGALPP